MHEWFWRETFPLRPLSEMIETYHHSVGNNGVLELDFAIDDTGNVHPTHAAEYKVHGAAGGWREGGGQMAGGWRTVAAGPRLGVRWSHASFFFFTGAWRLGPKLLWRCGRQHVRQRHVADAEAAAGHPGGIDRWMAHGCTRV